MLADWGSWDSELKFIVAETRRRLLKLAGCDETYTCVLMQGSGSFGIEAALGSFAPIGRKKLLMITNGAYGDRAVKMLQRLNRPHFILNYGDSHKPAVGEVERLLVEDPMISAVFLVHCETTSGIVNPLHDIAGAVKKHNRLLILDAMSSFGAIPIEMAELGVDVMISSANKCIEGVPGLLLRAVPPGHAQESQRPLPLRCRSICSNNGTTWRRPGSSATRRPPTRWWRSTRRSRNTKRKAASPAGSPAT